MLHSAREIAARINWWLVVVLFLGILAAFLFRYEVHTSGRHVIRLNRFTGTIERCVRRNCAEMGQKR